MKNRIFTAVSTVMIFIPWSIFILRIHSWALEMPAARIIISCYAAFMIFCGIFTATAYVKAKVQNTLMKICLAVNCIYAVVGAAAVILMLFPQNT